MEIIDTIDLSRFRDENGKRIRKPKDDKPLSRQEELDLYRKEKEKLEEFLVDKPRPCVHFILDPDILSAHPDTIDVIRGIHGYHTQRSTHIDIIASQSFLSVIDTIDTDIKASISRGRLRYEPAIDNLGLDTTIDPYQLVSLWRFPSKVVHLSYLKVVRLSKVVHPPRTSYGDSMNDRAWMAIAHSPNGRRQAIKERIRTLRDRELGSLFFCRFSPL